MLFDRFSPALPHCGTRVFMRWQGLLFLPPGSGAAAACGSGSSRRQSPDGRFARIFSLRSGVRCAVLRSGNGSAEKSGGGEKKKSGRKREKKMKKIEKNIYAKSNLSFKIIRSFPGRHRAAAAGETAEHIDEQKHKVSLWLYTIHFACLRRGAVCRNGDPRRGSGASSARDARALRGTGAKQRGFA